MVENTEQHSRRLRVAAWFLAITYGFGGVLSATLEYRNHLFSERFDLPPELIFLVSLVHVACAAGVLSRATAPWAAGALTLVTLGAIASHLRIGSPVTALPALVYTVIQIWFGLAVRKAQSPRPDR